MKERQDKRKGRKRDWISIKRFQILLASCRLSEINKAVLPLHYSLPVSWLLLLLSSSCCWEGRQAWNQKEVSSTPVSLLVLIFIPLPVSSVISCSDTSTYLSLLSFLSVAWIHLTWSLRWMRGFLFLVICVLNREKRILCLLSPVHCLTREGSGLQKLRKS